MTTAPDGTLYLLDGPDLKRLDPNGQVHTLARNLRERVAALSFAGDAHNLMGLWLDRLHNVLRSGLRRGDGEKDYAKRDGQCCGPHQPALVPHGRSRSPER
jgi:hypothetical protein